jgi:glycosyltransferase involved in cell wall biosynthesis
MNSKPKVLHVFHGLGMGGAETWIKEIIIWDIEENQFNFSIEILVTGGKEEYWDKTLKSRGIEIHYIEFGKGNINSFRTGFRTLLRKKKYLAIHDHQELFSGWHFLFGIGLLPKIRVAHFHNPTYQMNSNYGTGFIKKKKLQFGRLFIFLFATDIRGTSLEVLEKSGFLKKAYQKHRPKALHCSFDFKKYQTEGKAYNLRKMLKIDDDTKIVLIVGRFDYNIIENHPQNHKNTAFTLGVLEQLVNKKVIFVYIGANDYSINEFYLLAEELNVLNKLKVLGIRNDVNFLMQQADLLFFPSREEGLGMVAVEAQVCGLKVLASDGVPNECVIDNKLVSFLPLSAPKVEWSRKIVELLNEENLDSELNKILFEFSEFNIQNAPKILNNLYLNEF